LLEKKSLLLAGSDCYIETYRTIEQNVAVGAPIVWSVNEIIHNVDHKTGTPEIKVHREGVYVILADLEVVEPAQFSVFVNGTFVINTSSGAAGGSQQLAVRQILSLRKGDILTIVNWKSASGTNGAIDLALNAGGTRVGVNASLTMFKIAPFPRFVDAPVDPPAGTKLKPNTK